MSTTIDPGALDFSKGNGLIPVIIQDAGTKQVLMQAFMNPDAYEQTIQTGRVTFFSRSKNRLWTKGESSGNFLETTEILADCDNDCLLIKVKPIGPTCHTGAISCFDTQGQVPDMDSGQLEFLAYLETLLRDRRKADPEKSYTARLFASGPKRIAKKLGEEAVELALEAESGEPERFTEEAADLVYHLSVLLISKGLSWKEVIQELEKRHRPSPDKA